MEEQTFQQIIQQSRELIKRFKEQEEKNWNAETIITELTKQLGEVSKQVMMLEGNYIPQRKKDSKYACSKEILEDELSDVLFNLIRLADYYEIDLERAHLNQLKIAKEWLEKTKGQNDIS